MHGILLAELEKYVDARYGDSSWMALLDEAGLDTADYRADQQYPDSDLVAIMRAVPAITPVPLSVLAEDFGAFMTAELLRRYGNYLLPAWRTLDVLENVGPIYRAVGDKLFGNAAPLLQGTRTTASEVTLTYASHRRLCALAKGLSRGLAEHFGEQVEVGERACMNRGAEACEITVRRSS